MADTPEAARLIAAALSGPSQEGDGPPGPDIQALAVLAVLAANGYTVVPADELERLREIAAKYVKTFPRDLLIKPDPGRDLYVGWSVTDQAPVGTWTREEALAQGCAPSKLRRVDEIGTSSDLGYGGWETRRLLAARRGFLLRSNLAVYAAAYAADQTSAVGLLEPSAAEEEPRED